MKKYLIALAIIVTIVVGGGYWWLIKPAQIESNEQQYSCQTDDDCHLSCRWGAVNEAWYLNTGKEENCVGGCLGIGMGSRCVNKVCHTFLANGKTADFYCSDRDENFNLSPAFPKVVEKTANWKTYHNLKYNYLIKYPSELSIDNSYSANDSGVIVNRNQVSSVSFMGYDNPQKLSLGEFFIKNKLPTIFQGDLNPVSLSEFDQQTIEVNGLKGVRFANKNNFIFDLFSYDDTVVIVQNSYEDIGVYNQIVDTLKFPAN